MRLIDADRVIKVLKWAYVDPYDAKYECPSEINGVIEAIESDINGISTPVVRCKDCLFYHPTYCEMWSKFGTIMTAENGFCYWGKENKMIKGTTWEEARERALEEMEIEERDCDHCVHRKDKGCEKWDCEFERREEC